MTAVAVSAPAAEPARDPKIRAKDVNVHYGSFHALKNVSLDMPKNRVTALIGPSGCGKSTFLRCLNRMNDEVSTAKVTGSITIDGRDVYGSGVDTYELRRDVGMVFQKPNPFGGSIWENVTFGPLIHGLPKSGWDEIVERSLRKAALWDEVKDKLKQPGTALSGGQQQRLCIARALAVSPDVLLMDEPCSALDPIATSRIEDLIFELKNELTIVIVTHNMQQAQRASDYTAFFMMGEVVEFGATQEMFMRPREKKTEDYITGRFG